jgi:hypothetical protein
LFVYRVPVCPQVVASAAVGDIREARTAWYTPAMTPMSTAPQNPPVPASSGITGVLVGRVADGRQHSDGDTGDTAETGQHDRFSEELARDLAPVGAQRTAQSGRPAEAASAWPSSAS